MSVGHMAVADDAEAGALPRRGRQRASIWWQNPAQCRRFRMSDQP